MTRKSLADEISRRGILTGLAVGATTGAAGFLYGNELEGEHEQQKADHGDHGDHGFWGDVGEWFEKLGDQEYDPEYWQISSRFLQPDAVRRVMRIRRPLDDGGWKYRLVTQGDLSMFYQRLSDDKSAALTEKHGDPATESTID